MTRFLSIAVGLSLLSCLAGCTTLMQGAPLPEGFSVRELGRIDPAAPFAVSRNGTVASVSKESLQLTDMAGGARTIAQGSATALCFSPGGEKLAAAIPAEKQTVLRLFDAQGKVIGEATIPETVTSMSWRSETQLLATALTLKKFSFGSELIATVYSWDGAAPPVATPLSDVTVRPAVAKLPEEILFKSYHLSISPYGDEIAYSSLKDPPVFAPYQRVVIRHLETGAEREVGATSIGSGAPIYAPDGESLLVGDKNAMTRRLSLPDAREVYAWPSPGSYPAISPSGSYVYLDGRLYRDGRSVASFPTEARGAFLPDGSGLALSYLKKLYLVTGLKDQAAPPPKDIGRLLQLRRLRSLGLISEQEYRAQRKTLAQ